MPTFYLNNHEKKRIGTISGYSFFCLPCVVCDFCGASFSIYKDGKKVGKMRKEGAKCEKGCCFCCAGWFKELATKADNFSVVFNPESVDDLDLNFKLAVLAAVIQVSC